MSEAEVLTDPTGRAAQGEPKPGRPRDPDVDAAIHRATIQVLRDQGYAGMSVERVAAVAGVEKHYIPTLQL